jgi:hypothetical protein
MYPVELHGHLVTLREFRPGDLAGVLRIVGDDTVTHWLSFDSRTEDQAKAMLDSIVQQARHEPPAPSTTLPLPADPSRPTSQASELDINRLAAAETELRHLQERVAAIEEGNAVLHAQIMNLYGRLGKTPGSTSKGATRREQAG